MGAPDLAEALRAGDRRALARAITLVESRRPADQRAAGELVDAILPWSGGSVRVGVSGAPGVGKSTFIEALGLHLLGLELHVAVLAVDPSSARSGGSILGDKTRMSELGRDARAFIRPSPSGGTLGGVARRTRESVLLCEAAGFEVVVVETVGVGQSETAVADAVDSFVLLVGAGAGDELQGVKRGIMELADVVVITKADGELRNAANRAVADHRAAIHLLRPAHAGWTVPVIAASAVSGEGIGDVWDAVAAHRQLVATDGGLERFRGEQARRAMHRELQDRVFDALRERPELAAELAAAEEAVARGELLPSVAVDRVLARL